MKKIYLILLSLLPLAVSGATVYTSITISNKKNEIPAEQTTDGLAFRYFSGGGTGHEDDPFIIKNSKDWELLNSRVAATDENANQSGVYYKLGNDIEATVGIGTGFNNRPFNGVFDGDGHKVTLSCVTTASYNALFAVNNGTIKNVSVDGVIGAKSFAGGIACYNYGLIDNCINEADIVISTQYAGGISAVNGGNTSDGTIINCYNYGSVTSTVTTALQTSNGTCVGGVVGFAYAYNNATITSNFNYGKITGINGLGGIVGWYKYVNKACSVIDCHNFGEIVGNLSTDNDGYCGHIGGVVGMLGSNIGINKCSNFGTVNGHGGQITNYWRGVGGIAGSFYASEIADTFNAGVVNSYYMCGGIVGYSENSNVSTINRCVNVGEITGTNSNAGGLLGRGNYSKIMDSISAGKVTAPSDRGDIYGRGNSITQTNNVVISISENANKLARMAVRYSVINFDEEPSIILTRINDALATLTSDDETFLNKGFIFDNTKTYLDVINNIKVLLEEAM